MDALFKFIFFFLVGTTLLNLIIAVVARVKTGIALFNILIIYWICLFVNFFAVSALSHSSQEIALSYFFQYIPTAILAYFLLQSRGLKFNIKVYGLIHSLGALISLYLIFYSEVGFTLSLIPITITTCLPLIYPLWETLVISRKESSWVEKFIGILFITGIINHFNFAFFRLDPSSLWWGWSVSIAQYQSMSVFLPLLIYVKGQTLQKNLNDKINEVQELNESLLEEREINELLMRTVSHDIASPLSVINAYVDLMNMGRIAEADKKTTLDRIKLNSKSAQEIITRIRETILSRNQTETITLRPVPLKEVIEASLIHFELQFKEKEINVVLENLFDVLVLADEKALRNHVFANAFTNAIKFSHLHGQIKVRLTDKEDEIQIEIQDFGLGITETRLTKNTLSSTLGTKGEKGSGFGLKVMGYFLRKFKGHYFLSSPGPDLGTTTTIFLKKA